LQSDLTIAAPYIIAVDGWTTVDLISAIDNHSTPIPSDYDIVTLLIGVNDQYQGALLSDYKTNFLVLLKKAIAFAGNRPSHVIVLSIPDYGVTPFGRASQVSANISSQIDQFNAANRQVSTDYGVNYIDITAETRRAASDASNLASDGLHYSGKEYAVWASMLVPVITKTMQ
jgi:lysophospholipase L1-like esterase